MNRYIALFLLFIVGLPASASSVENTSNTSSSQSSTSQLQLSEQEKAWIKEHPVLRVAPDPDFPPMEFLDELGNYRGLVADYMRLVAERLGLKLEVVRKDDWIQAVEALDKGEADIIGANAPSDESRQKYLFSNEYFAFHDAILTHEDVKGSTTIDSLAGKKVLVVEGSPEVEVLKDQYPQIEAVEVESILDGALKLASKEYDYFFAYLPTASYMLQEYGLTGVRVALLVGEPFPAAVMLRKDSETLRKLIDKALASISATENREVKSRWISRAFSGKASAEPAQNAVPLTVEEKAWIEKHQVKVGVEDWPPIYFMQKDGYAGGVTAGLLELIRQRTGLRYQFVFDKWDPLLKALRNKEIDLLPATYFTDERATYGLYSEPYFPIRQSIYVRDNNAAKSIQDLTNGRIAVVKGYGTIPLLKKAFPNVTVVETVDLNASIGAVLSGEVDALLEAQLVVEKTKKENLITGLKSIYQGALPPFPLHFFSRIDEPILRSILQKGLVSITKAEREREVGVWMSVDPVMEEKK